MKKTLTKIISAISAISLLVVPVTVGATVDFSSEINQNGILKAGAYAEAGGTNITLFESVNQSVTFLRMQSRWRSAWQRVFYPR